MFEKRWVAVVALLVASVGARGAEAAPKYATISLGCTALGYTLQVPQGWDEQGNCTDAMTLNNADVAITATVQVLATGTWSDAQTRSLITADLNLPTTSRITFASIHGHRFGTILAYTVGSGDGGTIRTGSIAFNKPNMYKLIAIIHRSVDPYVTDAYLTEWGQVWKSMILFKPSASG